MSHKDVVKTIEIHGDDTFVTVKNVVTGKSIHEHYKGYVSLKMIAELVKRLSTPLEE